jgi:hypothetical protein
MQQYLQQKYKPGFSKIHPSPIKDQTIHESSAQSGGYLYIGLVYVLDYE